ncbi:acetyl-CoA hydrolase, partial [Bacteroidales bacterium OttesenSCG-928-M11]|nr:acetyl-CoA hydrolase [Bacteroidales bacterium OttesenSCG-928-M11]
MTLKKMTAQEAAAMINNDDVIGFSGFTAAGCPKAITTELAKRAEEEHAKGNPFKVGLITGASTGDSIDGVLSRAHAIKFRTPYQSNGDMRKELNAHGAHYFDLHLSELAQYLRYGFISRPQIAILEACDVTEDGKVYLTSGVGIAPTVARLADKVFIELNSYHPKGIKGMCD